MMRTTKPELLSPVGDAERLDYALRYGADAVYLGSTAFGMRAASAKFDFESLKAACDKAHRQGARVYLTCNTLPTNEEVAQLPDFLTGAAACGIDALIVADIGVLMAAKRLLPDMEIHISTQTGVVNYLTARELYQLGAKRVVLARELSFDDIRRIRDNTPPELDIECFVHGAMCMSFSGRCLLSNYLLGRDANRGQCAQPCRWRYHLVEEKRPGQFFPIEERPEGSYILNAKDLCMIQYMDELCKAGISSFKIEGRAKSFYYVAVVTNAYRQALDLYWQDPEHFQLPAWLEEETRKVSHRQYSTGFYFGRPEQGQFYENGGYVRAWDVVAVVESAEEGLLRCRQRNKFSVGDTLELLIPGQKPCSLTVEQILDEEGQSVPSANHAMMACSLPSSISCPPGSILRKQAED